MQVNVRVETRGDVIIEFNSSSPFLCLNMLRNSSTGEKYRRTVHIYLRSQLWNIANIRNNDMPYRLALIYELIINTSATTADAATWREIVPIY